MKIIYSFIEILAVAFFIAMMGAMIIQVISRYLLNSPISWIEECARFLFIWMIYCGAIISMKKRLFYKVDYFAEHLPNKLKIIFNFLVQISVLLALLFLFIYSNKTVYAFRAVKSVALHLPWKYIYFSLSFSVRVRSTCFSRAKLLKPYKPGRRQSIGIPIRRDRHIIAWANTTRVRETGWRQ